MAFSEEYYIHLDGKQKGPYTLAQLMGLYAKGFIPEETLYWMDGFEQWHPVADLCGPSLRTWRERSNKKKIVISVVLVVAAALLAFFGPLVRDGWREANQRRFTTEAAYWKARGFVREEMKQKKVNLAFERFAPGLVTLSNGKDAAVSLPCTLFPPDGSSKRSVWHVVLLYDPAQKQWHLVGQTQSGG